MPHHFQYDSLAHSFYVNQAGEEMHEIHVASGEIRRGPVSPADKQRHAAEYFTFRAKHPEFRPQAPVPDVRTESELRIRAHNAALHPDLVKLVRDRLIAACHTSPSAEGAVTAVLRDFGLLEPKETP